jgi:hypothetical protein
VLSPLVLAADERDDLRYRRVRGLAATLVVHCRTTKPEWTPPSPRRRLDRPSDGTPVFTPDLTP